MATYNEQMQAVWKKYEDTVAPTPAGPRVVADWAIKHGFWKPHPSDIVSQCADDLVKALREEYRTDRYGRRYRAKHAVRILQHGKQASLWADIENAPRSHMEKAFQQRRRQIVGDCHQLKTDVDVYNEANKGTEPIQVILNFTQDVEEMQRIELGDHYKAA